MYWELLHAIRRELIRAPRLSVVRSRKKTGALYEIGRAAATASVASVASDAAAADIYQGLGAVTLVDLKFVYVRT